MFLYKFTPLIFIYVTSYKLHEKGEKKTNTYHTRLSYHIIQDYRLIIKQIKENYLEITFTNTWWYGHSRQSNFKVGDSTLESPFWA